MKAITGLRILVPLPPAQWFGGHDRRAAQALIREIEAMGAVVHGIDVTPYVDHGGIPAGIAAETAAAAAFGADVALPLPNCTYALFCKVGDRPGDLFTERLRVPVAMMWDHGLFQFPQICRRPLPERPEDSVAGTIALVRQVMDDPLMHHYALDSGHVAALRDLGMLTTARVGLIPGIAYAAPPPGPEDQAFPADDIVFAGNIYHARLEQAPFRREPHIRALVEETMAARLSAFTTPTWDHFRAAVGRMAPELRASLRLEPDQSFYWTVAGHVVGDAGNSAMREAVLRSLRRPVAFYGAFADTNSIPILKNWGNIHYRGVVSGHDELPRVLRRAKILVDAVNASFCHAASSKLVSCFAAGGFALFDHKKDLADALGSLIEPVMYRNLDDLNAKIDHFLSHEAERRDLARAIGAAVVARFDYMGTVRRMLVETAGG